MPANEKRRYVMTSDLRQYIAEYTVANFWRYPIRRRVTYATALEFLFVVNTCTSVCRIYLLNQISYWIICMRCTFGRLDEFTEHILVILPPKIAKMDEFKKHILVILPPKIAISRAVTRAIHTVSCKLMYYIVVRIYQMDSTIQILL